VHLDEIDFDLENTDSDVLGDAYEYLMDSLPVAQEEKVNFIPQQVSSVLAQIVTAGKDQLKSVYDPTCGSGSCCCVWPKKSRTSVLFYGQEMNPQLVSHEYDYARCALQAFRYQERRHLRATATFRYAF
jgi:type I restriction enzyme M protein